MWWETKLAAWAELIIGLGGGGLMSYISPIIGIPVCIILVGFGVFLLIRAYRKKSPQKILTTQLVKPSVNVLEAYQSDKPLKEGFINIDVEFNIKTTGLPIRISKIQFVIGAKFIDANSPPVPLDQIVELESYVANFDLDYYQYLHSIMTSTGGKYYLCVLVAGSKRIDPILAIGNPETILMRNKPDGFNLVFKKAEPATKEHPKL
jgi:hypothetical protein